MEEKPPTERVPGKAPRILVLRGGALGDFLLTLPALHLLRAYWPGCHLTLVGNARAATLALRGGELDEVHSQDEARWALLYEAAPLPEPLATWLHGFDLILSFWPDPEHELQRHFPQHSSQRFIQAPAKPTTHPAARHFCEALQPLGIPMPDTFRHRLQAFREAGPEQGAQAIALHPGSSSARRNWPAPNWKGLAEELMKQGHRILLITGEADEAERRALAGLNCEQAQGLELSILANRLKSCSFYLGHDTGISHLAAALGLPGLIIFGPSDARIWAPQGDGIQVLQAEGPLHDLSLAQVLSCLGRHPNFPANALL